MSQAPFVTLLGPLAAGLILSTVACGDDEGDGTEADLIGVGAECSDDTQCEVEAEDDEDPITLVCLTQFSGGYCGLQDCTGDADCPAGSACVAHDDGVNYCFRTCQEKPECNANRSEDNESNCVANITYVDEGNGKACVPPSGA